MFVFADPPTVTLDEEIIHTGKGNTVHLKCTFDANPSVNVVWMQNGDEIDLNTRSNVKVTPSQSEDDEFISTLVINNLHENKDLGIFTCHGINHLGNVIGKVQLSGKPNSDYVFFFFFFKFSRTSENFLKGAVSNGRGRKVF